MKKNKHQNPLAALLLAVYSAFLLQGATFTQVLCYKTDGSVNLESAFLGLFCECCNHHGSHNCCTPHKNPSTCQHPGSQQEQDTLACYFHSHNNRIKDDHHPAFSDREGNCCFDVPVSDSLLRRTNYLFTFKDNPGGDLFDSIHLAQLTLPYNFNFPVFSCSPPTGKLLFQLHFLNKGTILLC